MTLQAWVADGLKRLGWAQSELARKSGVSRTTIWKIINGEQTDVELFTIAKLERVLGPMPKAKPSAKGTRIYEPLHEEPRDSASRNLSGRVNADIPVFRSVRGGPPMDHSAVDGVVEFTIPRGLLQVEDPEAFGYIVEGSSMEPNYPSGSIVIISPRDTVANGDVCFV